jgi:integrase
MPSPHPPTVDDLAAAFLEHAETYYRKPDGTPTRQAVNLEITLRTPREMFGDRPADDFRVRELRAVRERWIDRGLARRTINQRAGQIRGVWRWGVSLDLVQPETLVSLQSLAPLKYGRSAAKEPKPKRPANLDDVEATLPELPPLVAGMVRMMMHTGCRLSEARLARESEIDRSGDIWVYRPTEHKTSHHGHDRMIPIGPKGRQALAPFVEDAPAGGLLFPSPRGDADTPYNRDAINVAIGRACRRAGVAKWSSLQTRHSAATRIAAEFGIDAARAALGHANVSATEIYVERDIEQAGQIMARLG